MKTNTKHNSRVFIDSLETGTVLVCLTTETLSYKKGGAYKVVCQPGYGNVLVSLKDPFGTMFTGKHATWGLMEIDRELEDYL